jgi:hypothetical protein
MSQSSKFKDTLGQHMTPAVVAEFVAAELPGPIAAAVDLAAGDGALLLAIKRRWEDAQLHGIDCDAARVLCSRKANSEIRARHGDGLSARFPAIGLNSRSRLALLGNPPFLTADPHATHVEWQRVAFPEVTSRHGHRRLEMSFLARALVEARKRNGLVAMLMPSPFASGVLYGPYRNALLNHYGLLKVVSIEGARFRDTEASTVLLIIDTALKSSHRVEISRFNQEEGKTSVYIGEIDGTDRWDARYWEAAELRRRDVPTLADCGVDITRGRYCKADAIRMNRTVLHTTDLCRLSGSAIELPNLVRSDENNVDVLAEAGDILLSRTGTRVRWEPVTVKSGAAPITDHVLRIRAPLHLRQQVFESFMHPSFPSWLASVSKGVCATVITKQEILQMPLFAAQ